MLDLVRELLSHMLDLVQELLQLQERSDPQCHSRQGLVQEQLRLQGNFVLQWHPRLPAQLLIVLPHMPALQRQHPPVHQVANNRRSQQMSSPDELKKSLPGRLPTRNVLIVVRMIMSGQACPSAFSYASDVLAIIGGWERTSRE